MTMTEQLREMVDGAVVCRMFGYTRRTIDRKVEQGIFPKPVKDGRWSRWYLDELIEHQRSLKRVNNLLTKPPTLRRRPRSKRKPGGRS